MSNLDSILFQLSVITPKPAEEDYTNAKQQIKDLFLELIGNKPQGISAREFQDILRKRVEEL